MRYFRTCSDRFGFVCGVNKLRNLDSSHFVDLKISCLKVQSVP